ncbi:hypothetical protein FO519_009939 [Halicephalobus sp. NKZ332]|nr:hypothetical protein FO519_009939 [Halicephalobus sp. NKZ332]
MAELECQQNNGHLISVPNGFFNFWLAQETQSVLSNGTSSSTSGYWIGVSEINGSGWQNIDDGSKTTFSHWAPGEPANQTESNGCVSVDMKAEDSPYTDYYPIPQSFVDLKNTIMLLEMSVGFSPPFINSLRSFLNLGVFDYQDGVPINLVVFTTYSLDSSDIDDVKILVNQLTTTGYTITAVLTDPRVDITYYRTINRLNVVPWSTNQTMLSSIRHGMKCGGGTPVFNPCKSWISFVIDTSNVLSPTDYQTQLKFVSNAISKINHPEQIQLVSVGTTLSNWYHPYSISYLQGQIANLTTQNVGFDLNATLSAVYSSYIELITLPKPPIGALVFVTDTSSPPNYEGADNVVNLLKNNGFKLTFILMGPNVDQSKLTKYTNNFITWRNLSNPQPDNWDNIYLDAYACPK